MPIRLAPPPAPATPIELALAAGTVVRFPADARPELLVAVLRGLEERRCWPYRLQPSSGLRPPLTHVWDSTGSRTWFGTS
ncbi:hypothetical protein [Frigoriglobus tundricola]|uniref:hypothetical protein n=1 Tax=Frigoriglobus tundricola TaxID=2774151 RepID=UPI00148EC4CE|nr:hypothetical protein [Frigoriglobus tundricola]